ncbi:MAG: hydantoin utilization protein B, partial [Alphaproteobacteria bacterium]|nr:hydantoin utilization protein B [Alphaproteobacteria bacterium]
LAQNSAGPGQHRGGLGTEMVFQAFSPNTKVTARNRDRTRFTGWGIAEGLAGGASKFLLNPGTNQEVNLGNTDILTMGPGDILHVSSGGAGGWGDPFKRDPAAVLLDVQRGWATLDHARETYGVVIIDGAVDLAATETERAARACAPAEGFYDLGPERTAFEKVWTDANYEALTEQLAMLPVHWRYYAKHRIFAAIDAMPADARTGDGSDVRQVFDAIVEEFPELRAAAAGL